MTIGVLKETLDNRVAMLPDVVDTLIQMNVDVLVETDAGNAAFISNEDYEEAGAKIIERAGIFSQADLIAKVNPFTDEELQNVASGKAIITVLNPLSNKAMVEELVKRNITSFGLDIVPRTTRAQAMDILSSMATVAGYKAVLTAANTLPKFFPMFMSAAGTIKPAKVLILGAGVAGLQAIATSRKLGAVVEVFDVRTAVKEEVQSLGGRFVEVEGAKDDKSAGGYAVEQSDEFKQKQREAICNAAIKANVIICTAQIPGKPAPILITKDMVDQMQPGSVIIDIAASSGGNCTLTQNNKTIMHKGVKIIGNSNFASDMPTDASRMFGKNLLNFLKLIITPEGNMHLNFEDDIIKGTCITHNGEIISNRVKTFFNL